jgi:sulfopyruvate decarboxylase TPP-binding subunit
MPLVFFIGRLAKFGKNKSGIRMAIIIPTEKLKNILKLFKDKDVKITLESID